MLWISVLLLSFYWLFTMALHEDMRLTDTDCIFMYLKTISRAALGVECLASWRDGSQSLLIGRLVRSSVTSSAVASAAERFRCFVSALHIMALPSDKLTINQS